MFETNRHQGVGVVGAGLVGCLTALAFARKGFSVTLFEMRPEPERNSGVSTVGSAKSINLAVSDRGIAALKSVDSAIVDRLMEHVIPMYGRMIHKTNGVSESQRYGLFGESINSIDRGYLNEFLLDEIRHEDIKVLFNHKLVSVTNLDESPEMTFVERELGECKSFHFDYVVGCDGAHSQFRYQMQKSMRMDFAQEYIDMQYLELVIPAGDNGFQLDPNHLHIWPRNDYMLIALANKDGSFTSTFFSPWHVIDAIKTADEFDSFFRANFPDAYELIGRENLEQVFTTNPRGLLMQVSVYPYHHSGGRALVIGDAAHSMVPFYGQGMNCGFEDVRVLMELLDENNCDVGAAFSAYSAARKRDLDTIGRLALANYHEMSLKVTNRFYLMRKLVDYVLGKYVNGRFFQWVPMYLMISFRSDISYSRAVEIEVSQKRFLQRIQWTAAAVAVACGVAKVWERVRR